MKLAKLLALAEAEGLLAPEDSTRITDAVAAREKTRAMPWYLQALVAIGAWLASAMFLGFIFGVFYRVIETTPSAGVVAGVVLIALATALQRVRGGPFLRQAALAVGAAGHLLTLVCTWQVFPHGFGAVVVCAFVLAAIFYPFNDGWLHRFLAAGTALALSTMYIIDERRTHELGAVGIDPSVLAHLAALAFLFIPARARRMWRPLAYALAVSLLGLMLPLVIPLSRFDSSSIHVPRWPTQLLLITALLALLVWAAGGLRAIRPHRQAAAFVSLTVLVLGFVGNPAILAALVLIVLGFSLQERPLLVIGALSLPVFITFHYYTLQMSLRDKSLLLLATGAVLVSLELILARILRPKVAAPTS